MVQRGMQQPKEPFTRISVDEAKRLLDEGNAVVIDVRRADEWLSGHVKSAMLIPVDDVMNRIDELPQDKKLLFICQAGVRSALACEMAAAMGVSPERLFNIENGTPAWIERKYPASYGDQP